MLPASLKKPLIAAAILVALWIGVRYILPVMLPFFFGALLALAAEPAVQLGVKRLHLRRSIAAVLGVGLTLLLLGALACMLAAATLREVAQLASRLPDLEEGALAVQDTLVSLAEKAPEGVRPVVQRVVLSVFDDSAALVRQVTQRLPGLVTELVSGVGSSVLRVGTGLLSAFLISSRLPVLRQQLKKHLSPSWEDRYLPALRHAKNSLWGWLKAQGKLALLTWGILGLGLTVLQVPYGALWAGLIALVDAVPVLGTGTVLIPWAVISFLQEQVLRGIGLLCIYAAALLTRTVMEPRLVGQQLGLDPLMTLLALYTGFCFFGIPGMLLAPVVAAVVKSFVGKQEK